MKKLTLTVTRLESVAYDNHQVHCSGDGVSATIHLEDKSEFKKLAKGDSLTVSVGGAEKSAKPAKPSKPAKPAKAKK